MIEWICAVAVVALLVFVAIGSVASGNKFEAACKGAGGNAVFDGRQYQCIKPGAKP